MARFRNMVEKQTKGAEIRLLELLFRSKFSKAKNMFYQLTGIINNTQLNFVKTSLVVSGDGHAKTQV